MCGLVIKFFSVNMYVFVVVYVCDCVCERVCVFVGVFGYVSVHATRGKYVKDWTAHR